MISVRSYHGSALAHGLQRPYVTTGALNGGPVVYSWEFCNGCLRVAIFVDNQKVA